MEIKGSGKMELTVSGGDVYGIYRDLIKNPKVKGSSGNLYYKPGEKWTRLGWRGEYHEVPVGHERRTAFTPEQEKYNDFCRVYIKDAITQGENPLLKRFSHKWDKSKRKKMQFEDLLCDSFMECLNEAFDREPALLPAFYGFLVSSFNGVEGIEVAITAGVYPTNIEGTKLNNNMPHFVGMFEDRKKDWQSYEVQCAAPLLAMKIIEEVTKCVEYAGFTPGDKSLKNPKSKFVGFADKIRTNLMFRMIHADYDISQEDS